MKHVANHCDEEFWACSGIFRTFFLLPMSVLSTILPRTVSDSPRRALSLKGADAMKLQVSVSTWNVRVVMKIG